MSSSLSANVQPRFSIRVSVPLQQLFLLKNDVTEQIVAVYPISTSKFGLGSEPGSYRTPLGRFVIDEKIGEGAPPFSIFKGRRPTGKIAEPGGTEDHVLTRILWLNGLDDHNANTRDRYIYIHGTNQEDLIGSPASHGCIRMRNSDIIDLFSRVDQGTQVTIHESDDVGGMT